MRYSFKMPTEATTLAYIAGLVDGEGSIYVERSRRSFTDRTSVMRYRIIVSMMMCEEAGIRFLAQATGRTYLTKKLSGKNGLTRRKTAYQIYWSHKSAENLLRAILPYLKVKRQQAEACIRFQERLAKPLGAHFTEEDREAAEALRVELRVLNGRESVLRG